MEGQGRHLLAGALSPGGPPRPRGEIFSARFRALLGAAFVASFLFGLLALALWI